MKKFFVSPIWLVSFALVLVLFGAACRNNAPTATPAPPTEVVPTALPPAPTAPPLTDAPTAVLPTQIPPPAATAVVPTNPLPAPTNTTASGGAAPPGNPTRAASNQPVVENRGLLAGLYLASLRFEPSYPQRNEPVKFFATLINRTGKEQHYPVCAEVYRPGEPKAFGISNCDIVTIAPGTSEVLAGQWTATGIKECIPVRARAVLKDLEADNVFLPFTTLGGAIVWTDFNMCP